jgi:urease accessory protein
MPELTIIRQAARDRAPKGSPSLVYLIADRATLAKRRWRGVAEDGREFGFDLHEPLMDGVLFHTDGDKDYATKQAPEDVLEIPIATPEQAARVAWSLGNLHFGVQVLPEAVRVVEDPAVRQFLTREKIAFSKVNCVFLPLSAAAHHHHDSSHHHHE